MFETIFNLLATSEAITETGVTINAYHKDAQPTTDAEKELLKQSIRSIATIPKARTF